MICRNCGTENKETSSFCKKCGTELKCINLDMPSSRKYCIICGSRLGENAEFCRNCGAKIESEEPTDTEMTEFLADNDIELEQDQEDTVISCENDIPCEEENEEITITDDCTGNKHCENESDNDRKYTYAHHEPICDWDHTREFDEKDISDNKVVAMLVYLIGIPGIIVALLCSNSSPYAGFHVRQALKFVVMNTLTLLAAAVFAWTFVIPIAAGIFVCILFVIKIICFVSICKGEAKEPPIIRSFKFLK